MEGLTFDTGALIAIERARRLRTSSVRIIEVLLAAQAHGLRITVPTAVVGEWWHGTPGQSRRMLDRMTIEPLDRAIAERAGAACGKLKTRDRARRERLFLVDAIVVVSAAKRGDVVYTSDIGDLQRVRDAAGLDVRIERV